MPDAVYRALNPAITSATIAHHPKTTPMHVPRLTRVMQEYPIPVSTSVQMLKTSIQVKSELRKGDEVGSTNPPKLLATGLANVNPSAPPAATTAIAIRLFIMLGKKAYMLIATDCMNLTSAPNPKLKVAISMPPMAPMKMMVSRGEL